MTPRFSILTTAYRTEEYLPAAIASVQAQDFTDWELVVVDNGMSDDIADIVTRVSDVDPRVRLVRQPNRGWAGGVNAAAAAASGDYLCLLDSDDELLPGFCAGLDTVLSGRPDLEAVAVDISRFFEGDDRDVRGFRTLPARGGRLRLHHVLAGRVPYTGAVRRDSWTAVGGLDEANDVEADILFWASLAARAEVGLLREPLARVRERATSESRDAESIDRFQDRLARSFELAVDRVPTTRRDRRAAGRAVRNVRYQTALRQGRTAVAAGDLDRARAAADEALAQRRTVRALAARGAVALPAGATVRLLAAKRGAARLARSLRRR